MIEAGESIMLNAGLEIKPQKCVVFYGRRSGNNWYKGKRDQLPVINIQSTQIEVVARDTTYKYLGKSISLSGEDPEQISEFIQSYKELVIKIKVCKLPLALKASAINNMALAKILHHFYNTRLLEKDLKDIDSFLTKHLRELYELYNSTTQLVLYLPREFGGIGIKKISDVYYSTRLAFLIKMLNHPVEQFRSIARESLNLDMRKRDVPPTDNAVNFLGFDLTEDLYLNTRTYFGCQSDWPEMVRYAKKIGVFVIYREEKAVILMDDKILDETSHLQKVLFKRSVMKNVQKARGLTVQGPFLGIENVQLKSSHSIFYNWKVSDVLVKFAIKARLSLLPTNFTKYLWNRENDPTCPLCYRKSESIAHVMNSCRQFKNFYSRRHDRIVSEIARVIKVHRSRDRIYENRLFETIVPELRSVVSEITHRKPDIVILNAISGECWIVEVTVCFDLYFDYASAEKRNRYQQLVDVLNVNGYNAKLLVLCFRALGCIANDVRRNLSRLKIDLDDVKSLLKWCSISNIIGANYIWRYRVKQLFAS